MTTKIKATVKQINPRNGKEMTRIGYGDNVTLAFEAAIAGRKGWEIVSKTFENEKFEEVVVCEDPEADAIWAEMHYGR